MCIIRYMAYELMVMPFGQTNATLTILMNTFFFNYVDKIMVVYLNEIIVYSNTFNEHAQHL